MGDGGIHGPHPTAAKEAYAVQRNEEEQHETIGIRTPWPAPRGPARRDRSGRRRGAVGGGHAAVICAGAEEPVTINVVDVAGNLALTQDAFELYAKKNPNMVAKFNFTKAPAPELPGKLKAMQGAGRSDIDIVLTGTDFLAAGIDQGLLVKVMPEYAAKFPI